MKKQTETTEPKLSLGQKLTTVNTIYARIVMFVLTLNFALTTYAVYSIAQLQSEAQDVAPQVEEGATGSTQ